MQRHDSNYSCRLGFLDNPACENLLIVGKVRDSLIHRTSGLGYPHGQTAMRLCPSFRVTCYRSMAIRIDSGRQGGQDAWAGRTPDLRVVTIHAGLLYRAVDLRIGRLYLAKARFNVAQHSFLNRRY